MQFCSGFAWLWRELLMPKSGLELGLGSGRATSGQLMSGRLQSATMVTMGTRRTPARLTATTALIILPEACLLVLAHGSAASTVAATMADGTATTVAVGTETMTDSGIATNFVIATD